jgi:heme exporter protein D
MINEILFMNGYGVYVLSAFSFTLLSFTALYLVTKMQFVKEQSKFVAKFGSLDTEKANSAKLQRINKQILANVTNN